MDAYREQLNRPIVAGIVGGVIGLLIGLIIAYGLFPVRWTNAAPEHLRVEWQDEYLRMAIHTYNRTQNAAAAQARWAELGENADERMQGVIANPVNLSPADVANFSAAVGYTPEGLPPAVVSPEATVEGPALPTEGEAEGTNWVRLIGLICLLLVLLLAIAALVFYVLRGRVTGPRTMTPTMQAQEAARDAEWTNYAAMGEDPPMAQFMASYKLGDDLFDDSFSIDSPSGEFLGECGVGISDTIGVGDPKKVSAFEVWLFDKNDIQTVTKVLMSAHAFEDDGTRQKLAAKGEPVEAQTGGQVVLETATLQLVARVIDMTYGEGALPDQSFFDSIILELAVWQK